jgi:hypothetical protein
VQRHRDVAAITSFFTLVTTSASVQRRSAGTTIDEVLPACVGPTMRSALFGAIVTRRP